ncbi:renalase [Impatiens glandulifera]|uniref:renalase n=1 Tax=Impatiens glandulifera TaxID=253017 RepID=UPI001FB17C53|nr:renalase [Impatiens glandulifera]
MTSACRILTSSCFFLNRQPFGTPTHERFSFPIKTQHKLSFRAEIGTNDETTSNSPKGTDMDGPKRYSGGKVRRKSSHGTSRRSALKKTFSQEQVVFDGPISDEPVVGIIGGGMSGLVCAMYLEKRGIRSTVFDTGNHGLGGRLGTRTVDEQQLMFDHAAQFFTVSDPQFAKLVDGWLKMGLVRQWEGAIGELEPGGGFLQLPSCSPRYIGVQGMRPLANSILSQTSMVEVVRPSWISKLEPYNGKWHLSENGKPHGKFDAIVIAHNGKCANKLLSSSGLPLIAKQMKRLELSSIWALLAAFDDPLPVPMTGDGAPMEGAFVKGVDSISWMANNTMKLSPAHKGGPHSWTFFSTATFGKKNKVPQENIPTVTAERVKALMLEGVEIGLGLPKSSLNIPIYTRLQLWGAALPTNSPRIPCIFDPQGRAGICGDWLLGSSLEAAALSGMGLANHLADYFGSDGSSPEEFAVGLHNEFWPLDGKDIGQFPGLESSELTDKVLAIQA